MIKHNYTDKSGKQWEITKIKKMYYLERMPEHWLSPLHPTRLRDAKSLIDSGEANITPVELKAKEYLQELKAFPGLVERFEWRVWNLGDHSAELALEWFNKIVT